MTQSACSYSMLTCSRDVVVLRDLGPWDIYSTITNKAEEVVREIIDNHTGKARECLIFYYDSENELSELKHYRGVFRGFGPFPTLEECLTSDRKTLRQFGKVWHEAGTATPPCFMKSCLGIE